MKKLAFAAICTVAVVGTVMADEFTAQITKVDGNYITFCRPVQPLGIPRDDEKRTVADTAKILKGVAHLDAKIIVKDGDLIQGGLKAEVFRNASDDTPVLARITVADDGKDKGKIVKILTVGSYPPSFNAVITQVTGKNVTYYELKSIGMAGFVHPPKRYGSAKNAVASDNVKVTNATKDGRFSLKEGDPVEGGLSADIFKNASESKPVRVILIIADDGPDKGKITVILAQVPTK